MDLVRLVVNGFPCLREDEHLDSLRSHIRRGSARMARNGDAAVGIALYSPDSRRIDFLGIHPLYRKSGVAEALIAGIMADMPGRRKEASITTYRAKDKADAGQRRALRALGFVEAELLTEFGYPTQKFIIKAFY